MKIDSKITKVIEESKYLATENTWRYRSIIRIIYKNYEKMKYWLYKEEVLEELRVFEDFNGYSIEQVKSDLDQLSNWRNLEAVADTTKVNTIEEFKNREFRYSLSKTTIEIERMLISLEHMNIENNATLEASHVEKFRSLLEEIYDVHKKSNKEIYEWWKELNSRFETLNQNYQDYISKFYSPNNDELMKTTEFLIFKEGFIKYLRDFIRILQMNAIAIGEVFNNIKEEEILSLVNRVLDYEKEIKTIDLEIDEKEYMDLNSGRINSMKEWFIKHKGREALVEQLINNTNEIIRKITRYAASIADKKTNNANRKEEYKKIATLFKECTNIDETNRLSGAIFGSFNIMKILCELNRETESINSSIYEEIPKEYVIKPRVRNYREKIIKNPIENKGLRKEEKRVEVLKKREGEKRTLDKYIKDGIIDFKKLPEINVQERVVLLRLISKGHSKKRSWHKGDTGLEYKVEIQEGESVVLNCKDGDLTMPHYKILIRGEA